MYATYVCLFVFCSVDKRVVQIKKYSGLKFANMLGAGAVLQTRPFSYAVRSFNLIHVMLNIASWPPKSILTYWGRVTHICVGNQIIIGSDNGLSSGRRQAIFWTNAGTLLIGPLGTNFSEILIDIDTFSLKKMHLKMSSGKWRLFGLGLNVLTQIS